MGIRSGIALRVVRACIRHAAQYPRALINSDVSELQNITRQDCESSMTDQRCTALKRSGERCKRRAMPGRNRCWQHIRDSPGGMLAKVAKGIAIAGAAAEIVRTIIEILGPLLNARQVRTVSQIASATSGREIVQEVRRSLMSMNRRAQARLLADARFLESMRRVPGGYEFVRFKQRTASRKLFR